jgi:anti-sigma factor RsiW
MTPDIDHAETKTLMHAAIDAELDALTQLRFDAHLATCLDCAAEHARLAALSAAIRTKVTRHAAPAELRDTLMRSLTALETAPRPFGEREGPTKWEGEGAASIASPLHQRRPSGLPPSPSPKGRGAFGRWLPPAGAGFALGAALAASVVVLIDTSGVDDTLANSVVTAHIRALQPGHLTDVQISDQHQVKPWFDGKIDFAPPVKELSDQGFDLVGGRLDYIDGKEAAVVVYRRKLHMIDLFVTRAGHDAAHPEAVPAPRSTPSGYNIERWSDGGQDYWAVSDLNRNELGDFAKAWLGR